MNRPERPVSARAVARKLAEDDPAFITALAKGLALLSLFTPEAPKLTFTEICNRSGLARSSVNRFLGTLLGLNFIAFDEETRRYMPGPRTMSLGMAALSAMDVREMVRPHLVNLFRQLDETISYGVRDGTEVVIAERISTRRVIAVELSVGSRLPLHSTSMGRCLTAFLPANEREALIDELSRGQSVAPAGLRAAIREARKMGYATSNQEFAPGLLSVAMPVWDRRSQIAATANVAVPAFAMSPEQMSMNVVPLLAQTARNISLSLGAPEIWVDGAWRDAADA